MLYHKLEKYKDFQILEGEDCFIYQSPKIKRNAGYTSHRFATLEEVYTAIDTVLAGQKSYAKGLRANKIFHIMHAPVLYGIPENDKEENATDMLTDFMHYCDYTNLDFEKILRMSTNHFDAEND